VRWAELSRCRTLDCALREEQNRVQRRGISTGLVESCSDYKTAFGASITTRFLKGIWEEVLKTVLKKQIRLHTVRGDV